MRNHQPTEDSRTGKDVVIPSESAYALASLEQDVPITSDQERFDAEIGTLVKHKDGTFLWSPNIKNLVRNANGGNNKALWTYLYYSQRIVYLNGVITDQTANITGASLLCLDRLNPCDPIHFYINSGGGQVYAGLGLYEIMQMLRAPVYTYGIYQVAGFATLLLSSGAKGRRSLLNQTKVCITPLSTTEADPRAAPEIKRLSETMKHLYTLHTDTNPFETAQNLDQDIELSTRDAIQYGLVDEALHHKNVLLPWKWGLNS